MSEEKREEIQNALKNVNINPFLIELLGKINQTLMKAQSTNIGDLPIGSKAMESTISTLREIRKTDNGSFELNCQMFIQDVLRVEGVVKDG